ncbi:restriction endonuclease subunit S [Burkholderia vietnamiensis]|uniref:restriction endonuclease subunit S n=1 Tax=Burkholderia vietnamiensis TaxID=60552 RepID=UPI00330A41D8|nr:restriction endonuclease subunit S [Burkholderia vietnamiensis]
MSFRKYTQYKSSHVEWLGEIPAHWDVFRLKDVAEIINGYPFDSKNFEPSGDFPLLRIRDLNCAESAIRYSGEYVASAEVTSADILVGMDGDFEVGRWYGREPALLNQRMCCIRTSRPALSTILEHALPAPLNAINDITYSTTVKHLSSFDVAKIRVALPKSDSELEALAAFLYVEASKIDALIAEQEKLLELLAEKRQATISHAVTRGLNPDVPMKNSGVEWFEAVPEHWTVCTLRRVVLKIEQGWSPECDNRPADDGEWGVLKTGCVNGGVFNAAENKALPDALEPAPALEIRDGDLLMSRASGSPKLVGSAAYITNPPPRLMLSDKIFRLHLRDWVVPRFLAATFTSAVLRLQIEKSISGAEGLANNLPQSNLKGFWIVVPPRKEQEEIVAFVDTETAKLDALKTDAERAIDLLKERRKALISAAVTGKIDVREHPSALAEAA